MSILHRYIFAKILPDNNIYEYETTHTPKINSVFHIRNKQSNGVWFPVKCVHIDRNLISAHHHLYHLEKVNVLSK